MTILLSYNEIHLTARRAASGAGLPYGVAEAVGRAAVWLSGRGVDAVSVVVAALADGAAILDGLAAVDALGAGETERVALKDDAVGRLLLGLAGAAMHGETAFALDRGQGGRVPLAGLEDGAVPLPGVLCRARQGGGVAATPRPAACDAGAHAAALALAAKTYVPASELSRTLGAGAGTTDND